MQTPYVPHIFGDEVERRLRRPVGWLTAGVDSSIAWPSPDVCVIYSGDEYFLRGTERAGKPSPPGISIHCVANQVDVAISKIYCFTSILSWFLDGYVDVSGYVSGSRPFLYGDPRSVFSSLGLAGRFDCNHMPIVEAESTRRALAFWREGQRLTHVHDGYAFLSFYKVIESQFSDSKKKTAWISQAIDRMADDAGKRIAELRVQGVDVNRHLFDSGRCAVAHASLDGEIVDPDIPEDRRRLSSDLVIIRELARTYIRDELQVPTARSLYTSRDRLAPWESLFSPRALGKLRRGRSAADISPLNGLRVSIALWPDGPVPGLEEMALSVEDLHDGIVKVVACNKRETVFLVFWMDFPSGRLHTDLESGGYVDASPELTEQDVRAYSTYFHNVLGNRIRPVAKVDGFSAGGNEG